MYEESCTESQDIQEESWGESQMEECCDESQKGESDGENPDVQEESDGENQNFYSVCLVLSK